MRQIAGRNRDLATRRLVRNLPERLAVPKELCKDSASFESVVLSERQPARWFKSSSHPLIYVP